jgi:hypothetical protein
VPDLPHETGPRRPTVVTSARVRGCAAVPVVCVAVLVAPSTLAGAGAAHAAGSAAARATAPPLAASTPRPGFGAIQLPPQTNTLRIETIPRVPGAVFFLNGTVFATDPAGTATVVMSQAEQVMFNADPGALLRVQTPVVQLGATVRARFAGWFGRGSASNGTSSQLATFVVEYQSMVRFENAAGKPVAGSRVRSLQLQNGSGATTDVAATEPVWLAGTEIKVTGYGPISVPVRYRPTRAVVSGADVLARRQRTFSPDQGGHPMVALDVYSLRLSANDAITGRGLGRALRVQYPDGTVRRVRLHNHTATLDGLPRGAYDVTVLGGAVRLPRTFSVDRNGDADVEAFGYGDVWAAGLLVVVVILAVGLLLAHVRRRARAPSRKALDMRPLGGPALRARPRPLVHEDPFLRSHHETHQPGSARPTPLIGGIRSSTAAPGGVFPHTPTAHRCARCQTAPETGGDGAIVGPSKRS